MNHLFVPYELAVKLKNVGFYEPVIAGYDVDDKKLISIVNEEGILSGVKTESLLTVIAAPLYQQVVDWLWDKHMIFISIVRESLGSDEWEFGYHIEWLPKDCWDLKKRSASFKYKNSYIESPGGTYYGAWPTISEALTNAIEEALNLI